MRRHARGSPNSVMRKSRAICASSALSRGYPISPSLSCRASALFFTSLNLARLAVAHPPCLHAVDQWILRACHALHWPHALPGRRAFGLQILGAFLDHAAALKHGKSVMVLAHSCCVIPIPCLLKSLLCGQRDPTPRLCSGQVPNYATVASRLPTRLPSVALSSASASLLSLRPWIFTVAEPSLGPVDGLLWGLSSAYKRQRLSHLC